MKMVLMIASGPSMIGQLCWIGIVTVVVNNVSVANKCLIGLNATILKSINLSDTYVGNLIRRVK